MKFDKEEYDRFFDYCQQRVEQIHQRFVAILEENNFLSAEERADCLNWAVSVFSTACSLLASNAAAASILEAKEQMDERFKQFDASK